MDNAYVNRQAPSILIGIQARSGSTRLPGKAFELISGRTLLDRVIDACKSGAVNIKKNSRGAFTARVVVLTPEGDPIAKEFRSRCEIVEGPELDVLARYKKAADIYAPQYVARITGDCPLLPPFIISKLASLACYNDYDYVSNVDERFRTALDGADCEVMSRRMLDWAADAAAEDPDREHVTTIMRRRPPHWAKIGCVVHHFDQSDQKLSVDTREDLERVRDAFDLAESKYQNATLQFGAHLVHRI